MTFEEILKKIAGQARDCGGSMKIMNGAESGMILILDSYDGGGITVSVSGDTATILGQRASRVEDKSVDETSPQSVMD